MTASNQLIGRKGTAIVLVFSTVAVGYALLTILDWDIWTLGPGKFVVLLVASYLISAIVLLGLNSFVVLAHREYQRFRGESA